MFIHLIKILTVGAISAAAVIALAACGGSEPGVMHFDISVVNRSLTSEATTFTATQGDTVTLNLSTDEVIEFPLHGYEIIRQVDKEGNADMVFEANATGLFALEIHYPKDAHSEDSHDHAHDQAKITLAVIEIRPR